MKLAFADARDLAVSPLNMNHGRPPPDVSDLLPSVRQRGVLLSLLVLPAFRDGVAAPGRFEIVAGARRWAAAMAVIAEGGDIGPLPIAILEPGDDAAALEASLIENLGRLPPDEVTCWETFSRLIRAGRTPEQIGATFGLSDVVVRRTLALGALLPRIRNLYRREAIDVATVRHLTLASRAQQRAWLALHDDPDQRAPTGPQLKAWLFGGASIAVRHAIFDLADYPGQLVADLFGEDSYFADPAQFWLCQNQAIAARAEAYRAAGWAEVEILEVGTAFTPWTREKTPRAAGGRVVVEVSRRGEVTFHEGWLDRKEAERARRLAASADGEGGASPSARPEATHAQEAYVDRHRHAAVRQALVENPAVALRMLLAHAVAGAGHWRVEPQPDHGLDPALAESLARNAAATAFAERRTAATGQLGLPVGGALVGGRPAGGAAAVFARLLALSDDVVLALAAVVMAETLAVASAEVEAAGAWLQVDMARVWKPDATFVDLIRDRELANAMLREVAGKKVADGNLAGKLKTQKGILRDFLEGANDRPRAEAWTPRWMGFPSLPYTRRPFAPAVRGRSVAPLLRRARPIPAPAAE